MLDLRQELMLQKVSGEYWRNCPRHHIREAVDVVGRKRADHGRAAVTVGCGHVRVACVICIRITATDSQLSLSCGVPGKAKSRGEVEVRQRCATFRYGSRATFMQPIAVSQPVGPGSGDEVARSVKLRLVCGVVLAWHKDRRHRGVVWSTHGVTK